jgi:putative spermidine/putrescine transport system ATP-binding protein
MKGTVETIDGATCTVRLASGEVIDAVPVNVTRPGEPTLISIRPERVEFQPDRLPEGVHTISAEVLEFIYMGDIFRTRLRVAGNDNFVVKSRNAAGQVKLTPGERLNIGWLPEDCRALETA